jgi:hypothetical protein
MAAGEILAEHVIDDGRKRRASLPGGRRATS